MENQIDNDNDIKIKDALIAFMREHFDGVELRDLIAGVSLALGNIIAMSVTHETLPPDMRKSHDVGQKVHDAVAISVAKAVNAALEQTMSPRKQELN